MQSSIFFSFYKQNNNKNAKKELVTGFDKALPLNSFGFNVLGISSNNLVVWKNPFDQLDFFSQFLAIENK